MTRRMQLLDALEIGPTWVQRSVVRLEAEKSVPDRLALVSAETESVASPQAKDVGIAAMDWQTLQETVSTCTRCPLSLTRNRTVFGVGDTSPEWLFVGEGPGSNEDRLGEPFVGPAGVLLDNILGAMKLRRGDKAFIANIVKCRPTDAKGKDRVPTTEEISACMPYLERQIALLKPAIVVALGKTAATTLASVDSQTTLASLRGKTYTYQELPVVVTYHPAYLLRVPVDKRKTWDDLCMAMQHRVKPD